MKRKTYAISLRPDEALFAAIGHLKTILLDEYYEDMYLLIIHACGYESPLEKKEAETKLKSCGMLGQVQEHSLIAFAAPLITEYDNSSFRLDAQKHFGGTNLMAFKTENDWDLESDVFGYELIGTRRLLKPILGVQPLGEDMTHGDIWEPDTPFEQLCFDRAIASSESQGELVVIDN